MRWRTRILISCVSILIALPSMADDPSGTGRRVYEENCIGCHGTRGDGNGDAAGNLLTKPRDFTRGMFKFKSSRGAMMPTDQDLINTLNNGIPLTAMPPFRLMTEPEKRAVIEYVKSFSDRWKDPQAYDTAPFVAGRIPAYVGTPVSIGKGEEIFKRCISCHGKTGKGDGTSAGDQMDTWGYHVRPRNFTYGMLKRGSRVEDIFTSITLGVGGTGMPAHETAYSENDRWNLVSYVLTIMGKVKYEVAAEDDDE